MTRLEQKVIVRCKRCEWRIFDKITMTTGNIEIKCPKCGYINEIDLSLRKGSVKFRKFKPGDIPVEEWNTSYFFDRENGLQ